MNNEVLISIIAFVAVFLLVIGIMPYGAKEGRDNFNEPKWFTFMSPVFNLFIKDFGEWVERGIRAPSFKLNKMCQRAGFNWSAATIFGMQISFIILALLVFCVIRIIVPAMAVYSLPMIALLLGAALCFPIFYVKKRADLRMDSIARALPFAIDIICAAMNAGLDFLGAIRYYTNLNMSDPLSQDFFILLREIELGKTRTEALRNMEARLYSDEFSRFVSAVIYSLDSGTAIIDVMRIQADEVRRSHFTKIEQQIAKVPSKLLIPMVIFILPSIFLIILVPLFTKLAQSGIFGGLFSW